MSNDLVVRARQALGRAAPPKDQPAGPVDPAKGPELLARARAAISAPPKQTPAATPPPALSQAELVKLPMTCSVRGQSFFMVAERHGDELRCVGFEMPQPGKGGAAPMPGLLSGKYHIDRNGKCCPLCGNGDAVWFCHCERMKGAMHCHGNSGGLYRCACGREEPRQFEVAKHAEVRGASVASTSEPVRSGTQHGQPQLKRVSHERGR
jgi:hypothetical protein